MTQNLNDPDDYNLRKESLKLECPKCIGRGFTMRKDFSSPTTSIKKMKKQITNAKECSRCRGKGKIDWIEMATGEK